MAQISAQQRIQSVEYDPVQLMLFIEFEPIAETTYYIEVDDDPYILRRCTCDGDRFVGISVQFPTRQLGTEEPSPAAIRQLAEELVARYAARYARAGTSPP